MPKKPEENRIVLSDINDIVNEFDEWNYFYGQSILITGAGGLIASYLVRTLLHANCKYNLKLRITGLARSSSAVDKRLGPWLSQSNLKIEYGRAEDYSYDMLEDQSIVIHAASNASPKVYGIDPVGTIAANSIGTARLCEQALQWKSYRFLFLSSGEIYGYQSRSDFCEESYGILNPCEIRSCYAESKRIGEATCRAYFHQYGLNTVSARIFHTYGPQLSLDDGRVFADFIRDALDGKEVRLRSEGVAKRCFCYISDTVGALLRLISQGVAGESYNIANVNGEMSIIELANLISRISESRPPIRDATNERNEPGYIASSILRCRPSTAKLEALGWKPAINPDEGFRRTLLSYTHLI